MAGFDDYLSDQGKRKRGVITPMQDISNAGQLHNEIFGNAHEFRKVTAKDWQALDEADRKARVARNFMRDGTYDKDGN